MWPVLYNILLRGKTKKIETRESCRQVASSIEIEVGCSKIKSYHTLYLKTLIILTIAHLNQSVLLPSRQVKCPEHRTAFLRASEEHSFLMDLA